MKDALSKNQLDKLGSRLRASTVPGVDDLELLNLYRGRFVPVHDGIVATLRRLAEYPVESRYKSIPSIVDKLRRKQPGRLSAIQDIAGARVIVGTMNDQDALVERIGAAFSQTTVDDHRDRPSLGYRAVHVIIEDTLPFEVQVRTLRQHDWAELSERLADRYGFGLKYGHGPPEIQEALHELSGFVEDLELMENGPMPPGVTAEQLTTIFLRTDRMAEILKKLRPDD